MSKGKDFRPRKRGFDDDDGPSSYEPRNRVVRQPFGGGFDAPVGGMPAPPVAGPTPGSIDATVKWFKGDKGFGYDPIFKPDELDKTFGEMMSAEKHALPGDGSRALSHRARAFQALAKACLD